MVFIKKHVPHLMEIPTSHWQLIILIGLALTRGLIYLSLFPPWVAPDEPAHFEVIRVIGQEGVIPSRSYFETNPVNFELSQSFKTFRMWELLERPTPPADQLSKASLAKVSFADYPYPGRLITADTHPVLPHIFLAPISNLVGIYDIATELYILRLISILFITFVTALAWLITKRIFPDQPQFWLAIPAFIIFLPMHTHIFATVNTDVFAILLTSVLLFLLISFFDAGISFIKVALVISLVVLAFLVKRTVVFTILWVGIIAILYFGHHRQWAMKRIITISLAIISFIAVGLAWIIINPDILANTFITLFNMNFAQNFSNIPLLSQNLSFFEIAEIYVKSGLFASITFWGDFGGANINIPWPWAWSLMVLTGIILYGASLYLFKVFRTPEKANSFQRNVFIIFITGVILSLMNAFFPVLVAGPSWGPPARYFFPVIIPIATFFFLGVWQLFPTKYRQFYLLPLWLLALVTYDTFVISGVLIPFLYG